MPTQKHQSKHYQLLFDFLGIKPTYDLEMEKPLKKAQKRLKVTYPLALKEMYLFADCKDSFVDAVKYPDYNIIPIDEQSPSSIIRRLEMCLANSHLDLDGHKMLDGKLWFCDDYLMSQDLALPLDGSDDPPVYCSWSDDEDYKDGDFNFKLFHHLSDWVHTCFFEFIIPPFLAKKSHFKGLTSENIATFSNHFIKTVKFDTMLLDRFQAAGGYETGPVHMHLFISTDYYLLVQKSNDTKTPNNRWIFGAKNRAAFEELLQLLFTECPFLRNQFRLPHPTQGNFIRLLPLETAIEGIASPDWRIRWGAVNGLRICNASLEEKQSYFERLLDDPEQRIRLAAFELARKLYTSHDNESVRQMKKKFFELLSDSDEEIRDSALLAAEGFLDDDIRKIFVMIHTADKDLKIKLLKYLSSLFRKSAPLKQEALAILYSYMDDPVDEIQRRAISSLGNYKNELPEQIITKLQEIQNRDDCNFKGLIARMLK